MSLITHKIAFQMAVTVNNTVMVYAFAHLLSNNFTTNHIIFLYMMAIVSNLSLNLGGVAYASKLDIVIKTISVLGLIIYICVGKLEFNLIYFAYATMIFFVNANIFNSEVDGYDAAASVLSVMPSFILLTSLIVYTPTKNFGWLNELVLLILALPYVTSLVINWLRQNTDVSRINGKSTLSKEVLLIILGQIFPTLSLVILAGTYMGKKDSDSSYVLLERSIAIGASLSYLGVRIFKDKINFRQERIITLASIILSGLLFIELMIGDINIYIVAITLFVCASYLAFVSIIFNIDGRGDIVFNVNLIALLVIVIYIMLGNPVQLGRTGLIIYILSQLVIFVIASVVTRHSNKSTLQTTSTVK